MTKKVLNSSQSGETGKKEVKADVVEAVEVVQVAEAQNPYTDDVFDDVPFAERKGSHLKHIYDIKSIPTVHIAGEKVELKKLTSSEISKSKLLTRTINECKGYPGRTSYITGVHGSSFNDISLDDIWFCNVGEVNIYLTRGSQVIVSNSFAGDAHSYRNWRDNEPVKSTPNIVLIGSILGAQILSVAETNIFINSRVTSQNSLVLFNNNIKGSEINSDSRAHIEKSYINKSTISSFDSIDIEKSTLGEFRSHSSGGKLKIKNVTSHYGPVRINSYGREGTRHDIKITDITLSPFEYFIQESRDGSNTPNPSRVIRIKNRVDYGYFSGRDSVPFTRLENNDLIVDGMVFSASEFFPELYAKEKDKEIKGDKCYHGWCSHDNNVTVSKMRNGELWLKALGVITASNRPQINDGKKPVGKLTDTLVDTLLKQIESRLALYIEMNSLDLC